MTVTHKCRLRFLKKTILEKLQMENKVKSRIFKDVKAKEELN